MSGHCLVFNAGSSSLKFALFARGEDADGLDEVCHGQFEGLGSMPRFTVKDHAGAVLAEQSWEAGEGPRNHADFMSIFMAWLGDAMPDAAISQIGHRVVHGGPVYAEPLVLDAKTRADLDAYVPLAPLHQPHNLAGVDAAAGAFPDATQIACFDTAFHRHHPWVNDTFALPRRFYDEGVRRYGFHGLSYEYIADRLRTVAPDLASGRTVVLHLGNGASMCAMRDGKSVGSTMGFSALDGLPMGTRCGQIDPGVLLYLMDEKGMDAQAISTLLYKESGLKGLSGVSHDMRTLETNGTKEAEQAIAYFVFRIRRELGAMAAVLKGIDGVVFTGGIGENSRRVREEVLDGSAWLGIDIDPEANDANQEVISTPLSEVKVMVLKTNEELMIARHCLRLTDDKATMAAE